MKYLLFALAMACLSVFTVNAQEDIRVVMKQKTFIIGEAPAFTVAIPQAKFKDVEKAWEKLLKSDTKQKPEEQGGEIFILGKVYEKISPDSLNIYGYVKEYDRVCVLTACFQLNGSFISELSDEEIYYPTKKYIRDFAVEQYKEAVAEELKEEEKALNKLNNELKLLENQEEDLIKQISSWEREILTNKDAITLNEMDQSDKVLQMQAQKELILKLANAVGDEQDEAEKTLKQMEKDFKKLQKEHNGYHKNIDNLEAAIRSNEKDLEDNRKQQKLRNIDIEDQEFKTRKIQKKLENIE